MRTLVPGTARAVAGTLRSVFGTRYSPRTKSVLSIVRKEVVSRSMTNSGKDKNVLAPLEGRINFRARKVVHVSSVKQSVNALDLCNLSREHLEMDISAPSPVSVPGTGNQSCEDTTTRKQRAKRGSCTRRSEELKVSQSEVVRVTRRKKAISCTTGLTEDESPITSVDQSREAAVDFWHSSLSENGVDPAVALIIPRTMLATEDLAAAIHHLKCSDTRLRTVIEMHEGPKFEKCSSAFTALVRSIVFQQLATKAAAAIFGRVVVLCGGMDNLRPATISELSKVQLRAVGISERKASYLHDLAAHFLSGSLSDVSIHDMDDNDLMKALTAVKGIGVWSVHMFMLFSLHRPDVLPVGDLGVRKGFRKLYQLEALPSPAEMEKLSVCWQPYRSIGSWYMWRVLDMELPF